jgi:hypothetical protein
VRNDNAKRLNLPQKRHRFLKAPRRSQTKNAPELSLMGRFDVCLLVLVEVLGIISVVGAAGTCI